MKFLVRAILLLMLLLPLAMAGLVFTETGSRSLVELLSRHTPLQIDFSGGTLAGQFRVARLALTSDALSLEVTGLDGELAPDCLWRSVLCFKRLRAATLNLDFPPASDAATGSPAAPGGDGAGGLFRFPVTVEAGNLQVDATRIGWQGGEWQQGEARLELRLRQSRVEILQAVLARPKLLLQDDGGSPAAGRRQPGRIDLPVRLVVDELLLAQPAWDVYGSTGQAERLALAGRWRDTELHLARLEVRDQQLGTLALGGDITFTGDWPVTAESELTLNEPPGLEMMRGRQLQLLVNGSLAALAVELSSPGVPALQVAGQLDLLDPELSFESILELAWTADQPLGELPGIPPALAGVMIDGPLQVSLNGNLQRQQFELRGSATGLGYDGLRLSLSGMQQQGNVQIGELQLADRSGTSVLRGSGEIGLVGERRVKLALSSAGFELPQLSEYAFGRLQGSLQLAAHAGPDYWQLRLEAVDLAGYVNDLPARIQGYTALGSGLLLGRSDLQAELNGAQLSLRSSGEPTGPGLLELTIDDLGRWRPGARGRLQLSGQLSADTSLFQFEGMAEDLHWGELQVPQGAFRGQYAGDGKLTGTVDVNLTDIQLWEGPTTALQAQLIGTALNHTLLVKAAGAVSGELSLSGAWAAGAWQGRLAATRLQTPQGPWQLAAPVDLSWSGDSARLLVSGHCWRQAQTSICPGRFELGQQSRGSLKVDGDLGFLGGLLPDGVDVQGRIQLHLDGSWTGSDGLLLNGKSTTTAVLLSGRLGDGEPVSLGWDEGEADISYDASGLQLDWRTLKDGAELLRLALLLPHERDAALSGELFLNKLQLATLGQLSPALATLRGEISGQVQLAGSVEQPLATGLLRLVDGELALAGNPTRLQGLQLELALRGDSAELLGRGLLGGGELSLDGLLSSRPEWRLDLAVTGGKHTILYPPSVELLVSQSLQITASPGLLDLRGEIDVHEGELQLEQLPEGSVAVSPDVVEVDYAGNVIREDLPFDISMDLRIHVHDRFQVSSALIDATLGGDLQLRMPRKRPLQVYGNLNIVRGEVRAYQQSLRVQRGSLTFSGQPDNPALDIRAQRNISGNNIEVGVQLFGTLDQLTLDVYSEPAMSEAETMSYLVRGRGLDASAGADGTALALSMASGVVNRSTLVTELNRIPGVNNVAFGAEGGADDTAATVSGYIGNRIYLSYGVGLYEPINVLTARLYLRTRLWLEVVSRLENSVDLYYSFDID